MRFEEKYFVESNYSNYRDYRKRKFIGMVQDLITTTGIIYRYRILDFGCATGGLVNELRKHGFLDAIGTDISYWAIEYGRKAFGLSSDVLQHYNRQLLEKSFDYVLFTDVLEHVPTEEINLMLGMLKIDRIVLRVPVSNEEGEDYVLCVHRNDKTHIQIHTKGWWNNLMTRFGFLQIGIFEGETIFESEGVLARVYTRDSVG